MENDKTTYTEAMSPTDEKVAALLNDLKQIEAPKDFDFRVRARIADQRPSATRGSLLPAALRYAVPLVLLLGVGAYFGLSTYYTVDRQAVPSVAVSAEPKPGTPAQVPVPVNAISPPAEPAPTEERAGLDPPVTGGNSPVNRSSQPRPDKKGSGIDGPGGSYDTTLGPSRPIYPKGLDPNAKVPVKEILSVLGIDASFVNGKWTVDALREHGMADRKGLKAGDVIDAINDKPLTQDAPFLGSVTAKTLRVLRDGKTIDIVLKN